MTCRALIHRLRHPTQPKLSLADYAPVGYRDCEPRWMSRVFIVLIVLAAFALGGILL